MYGKDRNKLHINNNKWKKRLSVTEKKITFVSKFDVNCL
jgi:hypothetical protein